jgi:hypothetical protein
VAGSLSEAAAALDEAAGAFNEAAGSLSEALGALNESAGSLDEAAAALDEAAAALNEAAAAHSEAAGAQGETMAVKAATEPLAGRAAAEGVATRPRVAGRGWCRSGSARYGVARFEGGVRRNSSRAIPWVSLCPHRGRVGISLLASWSNERYRGRRMGSCQAPRMDAKSAGHSSSGSGLPCRPLLSTLAAVGPVGERLSLARRTGSPQSFWGIFLRAAMR